MTATIRSLCVWGDSDFLVSKNYPCLYDKDEDAGINSRSPYFHQDLYMAQLIFKNHPHKHVDVGLRVDGFVAHVASFREIELIDIRALESTIENVKFTQLDLMDDQNVPSNYCDSISSLHALEHFGLGRYGDAIDPYGHVKGFKNITKMLKPAGRFYFSVPMGKQRIEFNAHRVFGMPYLIRMVSEDYSIVSLSYIDDEGKLHKNPPMEQSMIEKSYGCNLGCALFELVKKS